MQKLKKHLLFPVAILFLALIVALSLGVFKKSASKKVLDDVVPVVKVQQLEPVSRNFDVIVHGVVTAHNQAMLLSEVSGQIVKASKKWQNGGFFKEGETLVQIETHQYENQVARAKASVAKAHSLYVQEQGQAYVAKKEWGRRQSKETNPAAKALALREPQLESAKAQYEAAKADLIAAEINLRKTTIKAPFDGIVQKKAADVGQFVSTGRLLAELYAVDVVEVRVPLTEANQYLIDLPTLTGANHQLVDVKYNTRDGQKVLAGKLVRTEAVLDELTKVLYGVIEISDPYFLKQSQQQFPLRIGSYVEVVIRGRELSGLYVLPQSSLRRGNKVWLVNAEGKLESQAVKLMSNYEGEAVVYQGLNAESKVVVGSVGKAMEGRVVKAELINPQGTPAVDGAAINEPATSTLEP